MEALTDIVVVLHLGYFVFVVGGFLCIVIGTAKSWRWISNPWFRFVHLLAVFFVLAEDVGHFKCPLNVLESKLRSPGRNYAESSSAISHMLYQLLHAPSLAGRSTECIGCSEWLCWFCSFLYQRTVARVVSDVPTRNMPDPFGIFPPGEPGYVAKWRVCPCGSASNSRSPLLACPGAIRTCIFTDGRAISGIYQEDERQNALLV
jgi:hypothetical protein